jgi:hypothetical protein
LSSHQAALNPAMPPPTITTWRPHGITRNLENRASVTQAMPLRVRSIGESTGYAAFGFRRQSHQSRAQLPPCQHASKLARLHSNASL